MKRIIIGLTALMSSIMVHAQMAVDVHTHIILPEYKELLRRHGAELEETFPLPEWEAETIFPSWTALVLVAPY